MAILSDFDDLKNLLALEQGESAYPGLALLQDSVDTAIADYLGRNLERSTVTEAVRINGALSRLLPLKGVPVNSVTSVTRVMRGQTDSLTENDDYEVADDGLELYEAVRLATFTVVYNGGLQEPPGAWSRAALMQVAYEWQSHDHIGAERVTTEGGFVDRPSLQLLKETKRLLDPYRHPWLRCLDG